MERAYPMLHVRLRRKAKAPCLAPYKLEPSLRDKENTKNVSDSMLTYRKEGERSVLGAEVLELDKRKA